MLAGTPAAPPQLDEFLHAERGALPHRGDARARLERSDALLLTRTERAWKASTSRPEHELLREQVARFVAREVEPHALAWEDAGMTPREVLRKLGAAGLLGLMYAEEHGGADADALTNLVFAEALSQSTFGGFIITVLVHTDMASPHLHHAGSAAQKARWMPGVTAGDDDHRGRDHRARRRVGRRRHPHHGEALGRRQRVDAERHQALHHQRRPRRPLLRRRQDRLGPACDVDVRRSRRERRASSSAAASTRAAGSRRTPPSCVFDDCRIPAENLLGEENRGFYSVMKNFQTERIALARDGGRPLDAGAAGDARPRARPRARSARRCSTSRSSASAWRCSTPRCARRARSCTTAPGG